MATQPDGIDRSAQELARFLRHCRASRKPEDFGLHAGARRRVEGLRREEVAVLANISSTWYMQLEQGRHVRPTVDVLDAIAAGLRLSGDEHNHVRSLAGYPRIHESARMPTVPTPVRRMIEQMAFPASVLAPWFDYLAWNDAFVDLMGFDPSGLDPERRNPIYLWATHHSSGERIEQGDAVFEALVGRLRFESTEYGAHPRLQALLRDVTTSSPAFRQAWDRQDVRSSMDVGTMVWRHPRRGRFAADPVRLIAQDHAMLRICVYVPLDAPAAAPLPEGPGYPVTG